MAEITQIQVRKKHAAASRDNIHSSHWTFMVQERNGRTIELGTPSSTSAGRDWPARFELCSAFGARAPTGRAGTPHELLKYGRGVPDSVMPAIHGSNSVFVLFVLFVLPALPTPPALFAAVGEDTVLGAADTVPDATVPDAANPPDAANSPDARPPDANPLDEAAVFSPINSFKLLGAEFGGNAAGGAEHQPRPGT